MPIRSDIAKRKAVTLTAGKNELAVDGVKYPVRAIAELYLKEPQAGGQLVYGSGVALASAEVGAAIERSHKRRCLSLILRMKDSSRPMELVFGLTPEAGTALLNDVGFALGLSKTF